MSIGWGYGTWKNYSLNVLYLVLSEVSNILFVIVMRACALHLCNFEIFIGSQCSSCLLLVASVLCTCTWRGNSQEGKITKDYK